MMRRILKSLSLITLVTSQVCAQFNNFSIFSIQEGLPNSNIYRIFQDSRGIIWLGTQGGGLIRYEGDEFISYTVSDGLLNNTVRCITEDPDGNLWLGTDGGINLFNGKGIIGYENIPGVYGDPVTSLDIDTNGYLWAGTRNGGLILISSYGPDTLHTRQFTTENGLNSDFILSLAADSKGRIWAGTFGHGINLLIPEGEEYRIESLLPGIHIPGSRITCISEDGNGDVWIGTSGEGAFCIRQAGSQSGRVESLHEKGVPGESTIWAILHDSRGNTWLGTDSRGTIILSDGRISFLNETMGMPGNKVLDITEDFEGNLWFSNFGDGMCMNRGDHFSHYSEFDDLSNNLVSAVEEDANGNIWVATLGGGLNAFDPEEPEPEFVHYGRNVGIRDMSVNDIAIGMDGTFWIATPTSGIGWFNGRRFEFLTEENELTDNFVNCLCLDEKRNLLWCGTRGGISIYNGTGFFRITETSEWELINNEVQHIIQDRSGNIWAATLGGLAKFHGQSGTYYDEAEGLEYLQLQTLAEDHLGNIWIGTFGGGLYVFDIQRDSLPISKVADNSVLGSNIIQSLVFFDDSTLIVATDKGFDYLKLEDGFTIRQCRSYNHTDGFTGIENELNASHMDRHGNIWFGTVAGLTRYSPTKERISPAKPRLHLTDINLFYQDVNWFDRAGNLMPWYDIPVGLRLPWSENHLTFTFAGISYINPEKIEYRFLLEGWDKDLTPPTINKSITYSGLKPGSYTLNVTAENVNGVSSEPFRYSFTITPPFWQRWWFYSTLVALAALGIFSYMKYRERQLVRKNRELEIKVQERTVEIRKQKTVIEEKNRNLETANIEIREQKEEIEIIHRDITDSIKYASRIQAALLPSYELLKESFADSFILFKPRDIVSGDFYWVKQKNGEVIVVAADCTGHGVPGAFMSMLGISFLNEVVDRNNITEPAEILKHLRESVIISLKQNQEESESRDGMDLALCKINTERSKAWYAGAYNPLWHIHDGELTEIRADRMPIAIHDKMHDFTAHETSLQKGDTIYMFSDGFADQFGGPAGKKFKPRKFQELLLSIQDEPMDKQQAILNTSIEEWRGEYEQVDDIVVVGLKI